MSDKLFEAIRNKARYEVVKEILEKYPDAIKGKDVYFEGLPLHNAILQRNSVSIIDMLLKKYPEAVNEKDIQGWLPLHYVVFKKASYDIINMIFNANPEATKVQDKNGDLPLHRALLNKASYNIIKMLFNANPEATKVIDNNGWFPLHVALIMKASDKIIKMLFNANPKATKVKDKDGWLPLHYVLHNRSSDKIIKMIFNANPKATKVKDKNGWLPLHRGLHNRASDDVIKMLLAANPKASKIQENIGGRLPLNFAIEYKASNEIILMLLNANPDAVFWTDNAEGMTPLHFACQLKASKEVIQILIDAAQRSDNVSHAKHLPPPQRASAICSFPCKRGRTPLWYALRYDAPDGIMELLLVHYPLAGIMLNHLEESPLNYFWERTTTKLGKRVLAMVQQVISSTSEDYLNQSSKVPTSVDILQNLSQSKDKHVKDLYNAYLKAVTMIQAANSAFTEEEEEECQSPNALTTDNTDPFQNILHALARLGRCRIHPALWDITISIFSSQVSQKDRYGNLPLHYVLAPCTFCAHVAERRRQQLLQITNNPSSGKLEEEFTLSSNSMPASTATTPTITVLSVKSIALTLLTLYPEAASIPDSTGRYPLHIALHCNNVGYHQQQTGTVCCIKEKFDWNDGYSHGKAISSTTEGLDFDEYGHTVEDPVRQHCCGEGVIGKLVKCYPEALYKVDSRSGLFPFMMAATHSYHSTGSSRSEVECDAQKNEAQLFTTGLVLDLFLESPWLLQQLSASL
jgi:ankyrin repeat protein